MAYQINNYIKDYIILGLEKRQWGEFFYIQNLDLFIKNHFKNLNIDYSLPISPKILIIHAGQRLSWQYHHRRKEIWSIVKGPVKVITSDTDEEKYSKVYNTNDIVIIENKERHRLVGLDDYAVVAELWCHTDINHLSDENDIVRIQDDYHRFINII